jgi:hypothetical protein
VVHHAAPALEIEKGVEMKTLTKAVIGLSAAGAAGAAYVLIQKSKNEVSVEAVNRGDIHGFVSAGFEAVREAFAENFVRRREVGAACGTKRPANLGKKTRWLLFIRQPKAWRR